MIFYYNEKGEQLGLNAERIFQGSTKTNGIILVCPATNANTVSVRFELADRKTLAEVIMERDSTFDVCSLKDENDNLYSAWVCDIPNYVTYVPGIVKVQFYITSIEGVKKSTATSSFTVEEGIVSVEPEKHDTYDDVLAALTRVNSEIERLKMKVDDEAWIRSPLFVHTISGTFIDRLTGNSMAISEMKILSNDRREITAVNFTTKLTNAISIIDSSISRVGANNQNTFTAISCVNNYGVPLLICADHENVTILPMVFSPETITSWQVSPLTTIE